MGDQKEFTLEFTPYETEPGNLPPEAGIFCVYVFNIPTEKIGRMIYVGYSKNIRDSLSAGHNKEKAWKEVLRPDESLCFAATPVDDDYKEVIENELIKLYKPECNDLPPES